MQIIRLEKFKKNIIKKEKHRIRLRSFSIYLNLCSKIIIFYNVILVFFSNIFLLIFVFFKILTLSFYKLKYLSSIIYFIFFKISDLSWTKLRMETWSKTLKTLVSTQNPGIVFDSRNLQAVIFFCQIKTLEKHKNYAIQGSNFIDYR